MCNLLINYTRHSYARTVSINGFSVQLCSFGLVSLINSDCYVIPILAYVGVNIYTRTVQYASYSIYSYVKVFSKILTNQILCNKSVTSALEI